MKILFGTLLLSGIITASTVCGQAQKIKPGNFVIRGTVKNLSKSTIDIGVDDFFDHKFISVRVIDGKFSQSIPLTAVQDIYAMDNDNTAKLLAQPGDTITLSWDSKDWKHTFKAIANTRLRQTELDLLKQLDDKFEDAFFAAVKTTSSKTLSDSAKLKNMAKVFADEFRLIAKYPRSQYSRKIVTDCYYKLNQYVATYINKRTNKYMLPVAKSIADSMQNQYGVSKPGQVLDEWLFFLSSDYRDFVFAQVQNQRGFTASASFATLQEIRIPNYVLENCHKGFAYLNATPAIRDWYLTKTIKDAFASQPFANAEMAYLKFLPDMETQEYKDTLTAVYNGIKKLRPGSPAPAFSLVDENGKIVSLSDFKGKVVYIDFWGVGCGPCIYDIKNYSAKLHEKYKDKNVVFLNICVDADTKQWKKSLSELHMQGTNLLAEGWVQNPVCKAYNVNAIPHYVLIDANGNLINNNADRMGPLLNPALEVIPRDKNGLNQLEQAVAMR